jgi:hypothetical protein
MQAGQRRLDLTREIEEAAVAEAALGDRIRPSRDVHDHRRAADAERAL